MTSNTNPTNLKAEVEAIDSVARFASRTIRHDETSDLYIVTDKETGKEIGRYETYREAKGAR